MLAALSCDGSSVLQDLCHWVAGRDPTGVAGPAIVYLIAPILVFMIMVVTGRLLRGLVMRTPAIARDAQVRALTHNVITAATYVLALLAALVAGGLSISVLLTFGGLASLAVGLAFQDVLRNLLAGVFLLIEQPFKIGDIITVAEQTGEVQAIQLRTTALKTQDGQLAILPNLTCFSQVVVNQSAFATRRYTVTLRAPRDRAIADIVRDARKVLNAHKSVTKQPAATVEPQIDSDELLLHCRYWLDYRSFDADATAADIATALAPLGRKTP